jgi:hypothetical protein
MPIEIGRTAHVGTLRVHRYANSLVVTDTALAGKRGKRILQLTASSEKGSALDRLGDILLQAPTYAHARSYAQALAHRYGFHVEERELRAIDVEPMSTAIHLSHKLDNGDRISIDATPHRFSIRSSWPLDRSSLLQGGTSLYQDTLYYAVKKKDAERFYAWLQKNLAAAGRMGIEDLRRAMRAQGIEYDYH